MADYNHQDDMRNHRVYGYVHLWSELCADMVDARDCPVVAVQHEVSMGFEGQADVTGFKLDNEKWIHIRVDRQMLSEHWTSGVGVPAEIVAQYYEGCRNSFLETLTFELPDPWPNARRWIETWELLKGIRRNQTTKIFRPKKRRMKVRRDA